MAHSGLPHFHLSQTTLSQITPIYNNLCEINFGIKKFKEIEDNIIKIKKKSIYFNVNFNKDTTNKIEILDFILQCLNNKEIVNIVEFKFHNKNGEIYYRIIIEKFRFTKIVNLLDFDFSKDDIRHLEVKFKYDKQSLVYEDDYLVFMRKFKLKNIGESILT